MIINTYLPGISPTVHENPEEDENQGCHQKYTGEDHGKRHTNFGSHTGTFFASGNLKKYKINIISWDDLGKLQAMTET